MSIHPPFVESISDGSKKVEFRKRRLAEDIDSVLMYATAPVKAVVGEFWIAKQVQNSPKNLWEQFSDVAGISRKLFFRYFEESPIAVGIVIKSVKVYRSPLSLADLEIGNCPPQSFRYIILSKIINQRLLEKGQPRQTKIRSGSHS